ncbi:MAG TPA: S1 RNA-binding domain-containing protein, partial [Modicisalibacter sp.]|nr:S1 RNA-binding domain-containing protein [Modicisalibacter sp.]
MSESFAELFEQSLQDINMEPGAIVMATVVDIDGDWITVNAGLKSEGQIPAAQFKDDNGQLNISIGDEVKVALE